MIPAGGRRQVGKLVRYACLRIALTVGLAAAAAAGSPGPPAPAGLDPGGVAIAIVGGGLDYADPAVARRLARDGEGQPIGLDVASGSARPYAPAAAVVSADVLDANAVAARISTPPGRHRLVAVKVDAGDVIQLARAVGFAAQTPAKVIVLPVTSLAGPQGELVRQAVQRFRTRLFLVGLPELASTAADPGNAAKPLLAENLILVSVAVDAKPEPALAEMLVDVEADVRGPGARLAAAVGAVAAEAACAYHATPAATAKSVKAEILARADPMRATKGRRVLTRTCAP